MVVVPSGSFMMGSPESEAGHEDEEGPVRRVAFARPFAVGVYAVTFAEWDACEGGGGCGGHQPHDEGWGRGRRPVINVSWEDAQAYVRWLSKETGAEYRLLSESEWEYAARAGTETRYWWGDRIGQHRANCEGCGSLWDDEQTAPVGSFSPNAFGLYDMHGNVWEWVEDCWKWSYDGVPADGSAWESVNWHIGIIEDLDLGLTDERAREYGSWFSFRVLRGGSWYNKPRYLRSAYRGRGSTDVRSLYIGFRVARTLTP